MVFFKRFLFGHHYQYISGMVCLFFFLNSTQVYAQTDTSGKLKTDATDRFKTDTTRKLKEVRIKANNLPVIKSIAPAQQLNAADFKQLSAYTIADAIRNFSGVNIKDYGGIGGLKTVSVRSLGANHTGVQLDGLPVSDSQNGQVDLGKINLDNVQSITLFNGQPGDLAVSAKSYAAASVLVIQSVEPSFENGKDYHITAGFKTGSFGLINPTLQWQQKLSDNWSLNFTNSFQKANGKYKYKVDGDGADTLATRTNADIEVFQTDLNLLWKANDSTRFNFRVNYNQSDRGLPGAVVFYNPYTNQHLWNRDLFLQSSFQKKWDRLRFLTAVKVSDNYLRYLDPDYLNIAGELDQRYKQQEFYGSGTLTYQLQPKVEVAYASDIMYNRLSTNMHNYAYPNRYTLLNAFSASVKLNRLQLQGTLLHTFIHEHVKVGAAAEDRSVLSPTILASFKPSADSDFLWRAFYKNIFRTPTFNDLYYTRMGNRNLKPEYASQYNLGLTYSKMQLGRLSYLSITADAYYNNVKDKIIAIPNKDLFSWTMLNLGKVDIYGLDMGFKSSWKVNEELTFSLTGNYTFQKALDVTEKGSSVYNHQIPYTPEHTFAINAGISNAKWGVFYNQIYSSSRYYLSQNMPEYYVPGFNVSDLSVNRNFLLQKIPVRAALDINNLFNQSYAFIRSFPMPGRSYRISIQIKI